jgi:hypothetical protein
MLFEDTAGKQHSRFVVVELADLVGIQLRDV